MNISFLQEFSQSKIPFPQDVEDFLKKIHITFVDFWGIRDAEKTVDLFLQYFSTDGIPFESTLATAYQFYNMQEHQLVDYSRLLDIILDYTFSIPFHMTKWYNSNVETIRNLCSKLSESEYVWDQLVQKSKLHSTNTNIEYATLLILRFYIFLRSNGLDEAKVITVMNNVGQSTEKFRGNYETIIMRSDDLLHYYQGTNPLVSNQPPSNVEIIDSLDFDEASEIYDARVDRAIQHPVVKDESIDGNNDQRMDEIIQIVDSMHILAINNWFEKQTSNVKYSTKLLAKLNRSTALDYTQIYRNFENMKRIVNESSNSRPICERDPIYEFINSKTQLDLLIKKTDSVYDELFVRKEQVEKLFKKWKPIRREVEMDNTYYVKYIVTTHWKDIEKSMPAQDKKKLLLYWQQLDDRVNNNNNNANHFTPQSNVVELIARYSKNLKFISKLLEMWNDIIATRRNIESVISYIESNSITRITNEPIKTM